MPAPKTQPRRGIVEELSAHAPVIVVNQGLKLDRYLRSADMLLSQANAYRAQNNEEQLYVMLMRFASLVLETIPKHKDSTEYKDRIAKYKKMLVERYFSELEQLKLSLKTRDVQPVAESRNRPADAVQLSAPDIPQLNWGAVTLPPGPAPPAQPNVDDLLDIMSPSSRSSTQTPSTAVATTAASSFYLAPEAQPLVQSKYASYLNATSEAAQRHSLFLKSSSFSSVPASQGYQSSAPSQTSSFPRYPSLEPPSASSAAPTAPPLHALSNLSLEPSQPAWPMGHPSAGPTLGPQEMGVQVISPSQAASAPDTCSHHGAQSSVPPPPPPPPPQPAPGGPKELVKKAELRDVHISAALMNEFLAYANSNTKRSIESCGILAGRLHADDSVFTVNTLIIPKQQGTSDTVQALNEEEIFDAQFSRELYPLGWIHTHPSQTCFLSSIDVHTQCGYQTMLDEAIAIVMAPTDPRRKFGIFRLSTPGGLKLIQRCTERGFHAHPPTETGQEVYEMVGHVYLNERVKHEVIDLR